MNRYFSIIFLLFFISTSLSAQGQTLAIGQGKACADEIVLLPVNAVNLTNIGAITLFITFDALNIAYLDLVNIDPQLDNMNFGFNSSTGQITIAWSNIAGRSFIQNKLFDLKFRMLGCSTSNVAFAPGSEIAKKDMTIVPVIMTDGAVEVNLPVIISQPAGVSVKTGTAATFAVGALPVTSYAWKNSADNGLTWKYLSENEKYQGVTTSQLEVKDVTTADNLSQYLCEMYNKSCVINTNSALLTINSSNGISDPSKQGTYNIKVFPNPCSEYFTFSASFMEETNGIIEIVDMNGYTVMSIPGIISLSQSSVIVPIGNLRNGVYHCRFISAGDKERMMSYVKLIKL